MLKNFKKGILLTSAFLFTILTPVQTQAAPQNLQLTAQSTIMLNGQKVIINTVAWYGDKKIRLDNEFETKMEGMPEGMNKSSMIYDSEKKFMYMMQPMSKSAIKIDSSMMDKMQGGGTTPGNLNANLLSDPNKAQDEIKKQGGKMVGAEKVLGYLCDIWQMSTTIPNPQSQEKEEASIKLWLAHKINIPLKLEVSNPSRGKVMTMTAKALKTNMKIPVSTFEIPKDYQITEMQKVMNQMQQQMKNKPVKDSK